MSKDVRADDLAELFVLLQNMEKEGFRVVGTLRVSRDKWIVYYEE